MSTENNNDSDNLDSNNLENIENESVNSYVESVSSQINNNNNVSSIKKESQELQGLMNLKSEDLTIPNLVKEQMEQLNNNNINQTSFQNIFTNPNQFPNQNPNQFPNQNPNPNPNQYPNQNPNQFPNQNPNPNLNQFPNQNPNPNPNQFPNQNPSQQTLAVVQNKNTDPQQLPSKDSNENAPKRWDDDFEKICANLIDEAQINTYLHMKSHRYFTKWSKRFQIPIIILSAVAGSGNFVSSTFGDYERLGIILIGIVSIITSILSSIAQYLQLAELKEGHRISSFHWEKFFNELKVQLMLKRECRKVMPEFYNNLLIEYQRLKEISPIFRKRISRAARKKEGYEYMNVPFYLNGFRPIVPYEKSIEDYQYYYMVNNNDKWINPSSKKGKTVRKKKHTSPSLDPNLTSSGHWNSNSNSNRRTSDV